MNTAEQKQAAAASALEWVEPRLEREMILGIGTGSTADHFIDLLAPHRARFAGAVASSTRSAQRLAALGVEVFDLDRVGELLFYIDGADEINAQLEMIKGGGGALTREKIVAAASKTFICIVDGSKRVDALGAFALPIEVIPMARSQVVRALTDVAMRSGLTRPTCRVRFTADNNPYITDNGNWIIDVEGWTIEAPRDLEAAIGGIVGVVESGLFALRPADLLIVADASEVRTITIGS